MCVCVCECVCVHVCVCTCVWHVSVMCNVLSDVCVYVRTYVDIGCHGNSSPIKVPPDKVMDLVFGFGVKILELVHCTGGETKYMYRLRVSTLTAAQF